ncbi:MAG TPA: hypothetical protein VD816_02175 [Ohtaekwangia sp.]|nr:hypothetical protein [Ohtaekwangia sp.]
MNIRNACTHILAQLHGLVEQIRDSDFVQPVESLGHSTIGQHIRHTLEFFLCFQNGWREGVINYDRRNHDKLIESDKFVALSVIRQVQEFVNTLHDKPLRLEVSYDLFQEDFETIETTATRELVYNIEHAVHHMAIIKIGVREIAGYLTLPADFGIAASTIRYKETTLSR